MKRDWNVIREILKAVEDGCQNPDRLRTYIPNVDPHIELLVQANLLTGIALDSIRGREYAGLLLTWNGHDFLELARDDQRWSEAMAAAEQIQGITFDVLVSLLQSKQPGINTLI